MDQVQQYSGSSGWVKGGVGKDVKNHEIYVATFRLPLFYDLVYRAVPPSRILSYFGMGIQVQK